MLKKTSVFCVCKSSLERCQRKDLWSDITMFNILTFIIYSFNNMCTQAQLSYQTQFSITRSTDWYWIYGMEKEPNPKQTAELQYTSHSG